MSQPLGQDASALCRALQLSSHVFTAAVARHTWRQRGVEVPDGQRGGVCQQHQPRLRRQRAHNLYLVRHVT